MDWKEIVKTISPIIGTALGGPLAGGAVKVLAEGLLGNEKASERAVADFITQASPEQLLKIKELEIGFAQRMEELGVDVFKLEVDDRKSAREAHQGNKFIEWFTLMITAMVASFTYLIFFQEVNDNAQVLLQTIINQTFTVWIAAVSYWYGTTKNSSDKTKALIDRK